MEGGRSISVWAYCRPIDGNKSDIECNFCQVIKCGDITRFKHHLSGNDLRKNNRSCPNVPSKVNAKRLQMR